MSLRTPNSGSTKLTEGRVPAVQSAKNWAMGERFSGWSLMMDGMIAVWGRSVK